jgi:hypothetical protein
MHRISKIPAAVLFALALFPAISFAADATTLPKDPKALRDLITQAERKLMGALAGAADFRSLHDVDMLPIYLDAAKANNLEFENELGKLKTQRDAAKAKGDPALLAEIDATITGIKKLREIPEAEIRQIDNDLAVYRTHEEAASSAREELLRLRSEFIKVDPRPARDKFGEAEKNLIRAEVALEDYISLQDGRPIPNSLQTAKTIYLGLARELVKLQTQRVATQSRKDDAAAVALSNRLMFVKKKHDEKQAEIRRFSGDLSSFAAMEDAVKTARQLRNIALVEFCKQEPNLLRAKITGTEETLKRAQKEADDYRAKHDINKMTLTLSKSFTELGSLELEIINLLIERQVTQEQVDQLRDAVMAPPADQAAAEKAKARQGQFDSATAALEKINTRIPDVKKQHDEKQAEIRKLGDDLAAHGKLESAMNAASELLNSLNSISGK